MVRSRLRRGLLLAGALACCIPAAADAQSGAYDRYLDHDQLTQAARALVNAHSGLATLSSLARTDGGRDIWLLTLANRQGREPDARPALLIVANIEGNRLIGSSTALYTAEHLLTRYAQDPAVKALLDERTVYIIPRANPDGAELAFTMSGYEIPYKPYRGVAATGGLNVRELGRDLNGDGLVTQMRVRDPEGTMIPDSASPRLLRGAERAKAERGLYRVLVEGIDPDNVDAYVAMGTDGVNLNRNFQHEYLYYQPHHGPHMVSEIESRTLVDFVHDRTNIAAVLTFSAYDNLRTPPPAQRQVPDDVQGNPPNVPTNLLPADRAFYEYVSGRFTALTGLRGEGAAAEAGSFAQFVYYQVGLPSFTTPAWTLQPAGNGAAARADSAAEPGAAPARRGAAAGRSGGGGSVDARWLAYFDEAGIDGYVDWTPAQHPTLGDVEVGGFRPNARINPPAAQIREVAEKHAAFVEWLAQQLPHAQIVETNVESRGDNVWLVTATVANEQYLPTQLAIAQRIRFNRPVTARLQPASGMTVLTGNIQQQVPRLEGMGGRSEFSWLVQAQAGTRVNLEVFAERAGGLQSVPLTLR
ncbi:MAG TPA: M14 family metallopeptidase [Longimicrobiales bacterium]|nr:M14 family metallopeptidase [Longimicrobiales bacterium]